MNTVKDEVVKVERNKGEGKDIKYLDNLDCEFEITEGGFLRLRVEGKEYPYVELYKAFPFTHSKDYIFVKDKEGVEIGCIENVNNYPEQIQELFKVELKRRYFIPKVLKILGLKETLGEYRWDVETDSGKVSFNTTRRRGNLIMIGDNRILVKDDAGNRYEIPNIEDIKSSKYRRMIEAVIY